MRRLKQLAALVLTGTLLLAMAGCSQTGSAQQPDTVTVAGSGEVLLEPDLAVINLGVESTGATPEAARSANATAVNATVDAVKALGVEEKDIQTSSMNLGESYTTTGYEMSTQLTVTVRSVNAERNRAELDTVCTNQDGVQVVTGAAKVMPPKA